MADKNYYRDYADSVIKNNKQSDIGLLFASDIVLDEEAFRTAVNDINALIQKIDALKNQINEMLAALQKGMDTPAGRKFMKSCNSCLLEPIEQQKTVISHIAEDLDMSVAMYSNLFIGYEKLQTALNQIDPV